jgi:hypothetical protein
MSERIYAWLLKLYPARFREEYGAQVLQLFRDRLQAERGVLRRFRFWLDVFVDLALSIPREHCRQQSPSESSSGGHRLSEEAVTSMTKRALIVPAVGTSVFVLVGLTAGWLGNSQWVLLFVVYTPLVICAARRFGYINQFEERWRSYELLLEADRFRLKQQGKDVTVLRSQVVKINEDQHGVLIVSLRGDRPTAGWTEIAYDSAVFATTWIPAGLVSYERVREQVLQWTENVSHRRSLWLSEPRLVRNCIWSLLPAVLLVRSPDWFVAVAIAYYGMILLAIMMHVVRPPRNSGSTPRRQTLRLPPARYMWDRLKHQGREPLLLVLVVSPILRTMLARHH